MGLDSSRAVQRSGGYKFNVRNDGRINDSKWVLVSGELSRLLQINDGHKIMITLVTEEKRGTYCDVNS